MALCLAASLVERGFDPRDQMTRYVRWWREGYWSSTGRCFDIGNAVASALRRFEQTRDPIAGSTDRYSAGNGSVMRLAPVPLRYARDPAEAVRLAGESSRTTHGVAEAVDACRYLATLIVGALAGRSKEELLAGVRTWSDPALAPAVDAVAAGSYLTKTADQIREAALWAFHHTDTFRDGALLGVNLGEDADTAGAVYGQLGGAYYGLSGIPRE